MRPSVKTDPPATPHPDMDAAPTGQWQALRVILWLGAHAPTTPVRLTRSPAEQVFASWWSETGAQVEVLLTFDWPAAGPAVVSAASLVDAVKTSYTTPFDGLSLGVDALVEATGEATGEAPLPVVEDHTLRIGKHLSQQNWAGLVEACHDLWQQWDGSEDVPLPSQATHYALAPQVALTLGQLYPLGREEPGQVATITAPFGTIISSQFVSIGPGAH